MEKTHAHFNANKKAQDAFPASVRNESDYPIIVHSHLCWDWVWQRPQQFLSRLSSHHPVLFVETLPPDPHLSSPLCRFQVPREFPISRCFGSSFRRGAGETPNLSTANAVVS